MNDRKHDAKVLRALADDVDKQRKSMPDGAAADGWKRAAANLREIADRTHAPTDEQQRKADRRRARAEASKQKRVSPSEAVYAFAGWLTGLEQDLVVGAAHEAGVVSALVDRFCRVQGWQDPRDGWARRIKPVTQSAPATEAQTTGAA